MSCMGTWYLKGILMPSVSIDSTTALDAVNRLRNRKTYRRHAACHTQAKSIYRILPNHHPKACQGKYICGKKDRLRCLLRLC